MPGRWSRRAGDADPPVADADVQRARVEINASGELAIKSRGEWVPGVVDPACQGSGQADGRIFRRSLMQMYSGLGLKVITPTAQSFQGIRYYLCGKLTPAVNAVETWQANCRGLAITCEQKVKGFLELRKLLQGVPPLPSRR
jgi:hypothetical protein